MEVKLERIRKHPSLKEEAYRRIKALVLSDTLSRGDVLDMDWLSSELGISRTPLREALLMLEQDGLVETIPYKGTFVAGVSTTDVEEIYQVRGALEALAVRLATPVIPDEELESMGMKNAFDMNKANFSGMDGNPNWLYIGAVVHKAFVDVNEEGTEAAAATGVRTRGKSEPPPPIIFQADHPFLFLIRDNSTESVLFIGRLSRP